MKIQTALKNNRGFTVLEALVVSVVVLVLAALVLPFLVRSRRPGTAIRANCMNNLKQVGLAFRIFQQDNGEYPMHYSTKDFDGPGYASDKQMFMYFKSLSNELTIPKFLICPMDNQRSIATNFDVDFNSSHVSYFAGLNADEAVPMSFLAGDRNLGTATPPKNGVLEITTNQVPAGAAPFVTWTKGLHSPGGNILFADYHVEMVDSKKLCDALRTSGLATNRLVLP
jgi:type II secretory pathway pseudopilin PulG